MTHLRQIMLEELEVVLVALTCQSCLSPAIRALPGSDCHPMRDGSGNSGQIAVAALALDCGGAAGGCEVGHSTAQALCFWAWVATVAGVSHGGTVHCGARRRINDGGMEAMYGLS